MENLHRPAVIIGVGGTGQTVLTHLKKELLEANQGEMPNNIRLLSFDTMPTAEAGGEADQKEVYSIQNIKLETGTEFFGLMGNGWDIGTQVIHNEAPHIGRTLDKAGHSYTWFDSPFYRQEIPVALWDLSAGAGRIRQFGRLAFFMKVDTEIRPRIINAIQAVNNHVNENQELEVIIISSFAGGTGAGMFIDMGLLCRDLGSLVDNHLIIRGMFVLPRTFVSTENKDVQARQMMARSFAAWRELDRYMNIGATYGTHKISYKVNDDQPIEVSARPYDVCYLVDSKSARQSLEATPPDEGVMPAIADFISLILDERAGIPFTNDTRNYLSNLDKANRKPGYSAFRAYTVKVPIYYDIFGNTLSFAKDMLERWLIPVRSPDTGVIKRIAENQNKENPDQQGRDGVIPFLQSQNRPIYARVDRLSASVEKDDNAVRQLENSPLFSKVADVYKLRNDPGRARQLKDEDARGGTSYVATDEMVSVGTYLGQLVSLPGDSNATKIVVDGIEREVMIGDVNAEARIAIWDEVPPSKDYFGVYGYGDSPLDALSRFQDETTGIPAFEKKHYGAGAGNKGKFGTMLVECSTWQIARFAELLREWTIATLNGEGLDAYQGLSGKLGYVQDFYDHLVRCFDYFVNTHLKDVMVIRNNENPMVYAKEDCEQAWYAMEDWVHRKCLFFFDHPRAHAMQRSYLDAVDYRFSVIKDEMVLTTIKETCEKILEVIRKGKEQVDQWANALVLGGENISGVYREICVDEEKVESLLASDKNSSRINFVTPEYEYHQDVTALDDKLKRINWDVRAIDGELNIECAVLTLTDQVNEAGQPIYKSVLLQPGDTKLHQDENKKVLMDFCRENFIKLRDQRLVLDQIMNYHDVNHDFRDPVNLANHLDLYSDVLADLSAAGSAARQINSYYLRLMDPVETSQDDSVGSRSSQVKYIQDLEDRLKSLTVGDAAATGFRRLNSKDQYKLTMLKTIDQIQDIDFSIWKELKKAYFNKVVSSGGEEDGQHLHIFPAECNAVRYESRLSDILGKPYRSFHPRVVMLMVHVDRLSLFFRCLGLGLIKRVENNKTGEKNYIFDVPEMGHFIKQFIYVTSNIDAYGNFKYGGWPDAFMVIDRFVQGKDARNPQKKISWSMLNNTINLIESQLRNEEPDLHDKYMNEIDHGICASLHSQYKKILNEYLQKHPDTKAGEDWIWREDGQEFEDLADIAEMIYREVLAGDQVILG